MDAQLAKALIPILVPLIVFATPVVAIFVNRYFKLKHRELELEGELQKKFSEEQRRQMEARIAALEGAMQMVMSLVTGRPPQQAQQQQQLAQPVAQVAQSGAQDLQALARVAEGPGAQSAQPQTAPGARERG